MVFCRIAGALILALSGVLGARWMNQSMAEALSQVEGWLALLRYVRMQVDCFALPMPVILARADPELLRRCGYREGSPPQSFGALLASCEIRDGTCAELVRGFSEEFGKSYREEQSRGCEYYEVLLDERREALLSQLPARKKVNATLWVSGALAIVILLI